jgi:tetratricopeptide (TPR) repeat protein
MIARAMVQINQLEAAETMLADALTAPKLSNLELAELLYVQSFLANFAGRYAAAETGFTTFLHTLEALSDGSPRYCEMRAGALQLRAYMHNVLGRPAEATSDIRQALPFHAEIGDASHYAQLQSELGLYLLESGEYGSAEDVLQEARSVLERIDNPIYLSMLERIQARLYLESAPPHGAALSLKHARAALSQIERAGRPPSFMSGAIFITAWAEALHGRPEESLRLANELEELPAAQPSFAAGAAWVRALAIERLGDLETARGWLQRAAERAAPMRLGPTLERMNLELDRLNGDLEGAARRAQRFQSAGALSALWVTGRYFPELRDPSETAPNQVTEPQDTTLPVHLEVLGPIRITVNTTLLRRGGGKANEFLVALLEARLAGRSGRSDLELFDALYPDVPEDRAASALKQLVYRLRASLGAGAILRLENGYALGAVTSDAEQFLQTGDTRLWRGPYQSGPPAPTTSSAADRLLRALHDRMRALETTDDPAEAARIGALLLEGNPFDLEVLALSLRALEAGHDARGATRLYEAARAQFAELGENLPATWQDFRASHLS